MMVAHVFTIDANIGAGKTTVLEYLHRCHDIRIDPEPVCKWMPYLEDMYRNDQGTFQFQVRVWLDRCWLPQSDQDVVMERSPYFQRHVFVPVNVDNKRFSSKEFELITEMYDLSMRTWSPKGMVYLRSDPAQCYARIAKRSRDSEDAIPLQYLENIHRYHEAAFANGVSAGLPIIAVDVEGKTVEQIANEVIDALRTLGM